MGQTEPAGPAACGTCRANRGELAAPGGVIYQDALWRLEHVLPPLPLAGWLVLKPLRHVEAFADLTPQEAAAFGPLVRRATGALRDVLAPAKVYLCQFSEAPGFAHIHFHLIPRAPEMPREQWGPAVFGLLNEATGAGHDLVPAQEAERVAAGVRERLRRPDGEDRT